MIKCISFVRSSAAAHGFLYAFGGHDAPASQPNAARFDCVER